LVRSRRKDLQRGFVGAGAAQRLPVGAVSRLLVLHSGRRSRSKEHVLVDRSAVQSTRRPKPSAVADADDSGGTVMGLAAGDQGLGRREGVQRVHASPTEPRPLAARQPGPDDRAEILLQPEQFIRQLRPHASHRDSVPQPPAIAPSPQPPSPLLPPPPTKPRSRFFFSSAPPTTS